MAFLKNCYANNAPIEHPSKKELNGPYYPLRGEIDLDDDDDLFDKWQKDDINDALNYIRQMISISDNNKQPTPETQIQDCPEILKLLEDN